MSIYMNIMAIILSIMMTFGAYTPESLTIENVPEKADGAVRVVSFNVRCKDDLYGSVENRGKLIVAALEQYRPDSFGVQEATQQWLDLLIEALGDEYDYVTQMRDASSSTEASAVFYLKGKYDLEDSGTIWLSDTPEEFGSKFALSACSRIATWATLKDKASGKTYTHINTHLDHIFECVRVDQVKVLKTKITDLAAKGYPIVCTGDFNTKQGADAYNEMTTLLNDTKFLAKESDDGATFHNYGRNIAETKPIDFIFVSDGVEVDTYKIIDEKIDKLYLSDHAGLCADLIF